MSLRDLLSNHKSSVLFPTAPQLQAVNVTEPIDLSLGLTAMFQIITLQAFSSTSIITSMVLQYSDDPTFPDSVEFPTVDDPLDPITGLSTLGNTIYNVEVGDFEFPRLFTSIPDASENWAVPYELGSFALNAVVSVVNPLGTYNYCRVKFEATLTAAEEVLGGYGFVGQIRNKNVDGGIA